MIIAVSEIVKIGWFLPFVIIICGIAGFVFKLLLKKPSSKPQKRKRKKR